jgi:hypothetical protein
VRSYLSVPACEDCSLTVRREAGRTGTFTPEADDMDPLDHDGNGLIVIAMVVIAICAGLVGFGFGRLL